MSRQSRLSSGAVFFLAVTYASRRPLSKSPHHTTYCAIDAKDETEARQLAAQMVETQCGAWVNRPHPEMVIAVDIIGCDV